MNQQLALDIGYPENWLESQGLIFSDEEIASIRVGILIDALQSGIDSRCTAEVKKEMQEWIDSDDIEPFSFVVCAEAAGSDAVELREVYKRLCERESQ